MGMRGFKRAVAGLARAVYRLSLLGSRRGPHVTRYAMYRRLARHAAARDPAHRVLAISGSGNLAILLGYAPEQITHAAHPEYDVRALPFADDAFDAVVSDQVLEHIEGDPFAAIRELFRVLKPGGLALHTTCFINPIHGAPQDFWRFTPEGLRLLFREHAEPIEIAGWGNPLVWVFVLLGLRNEPIPEAKWHPAHWLATHDHPDWPIVTWAMGTKIRPPG
jgi:SAM-dependent methyltransferase